MRTNNATLAGLILTLTWLTVGCGQQLTPEKKSVKAEIENAHKGESVTFLHWSQCHSSDVNVKEYVVAKLAQMRVPLEVAIRESRDLQQKPRDELIAYRETIRAAWKHDDERIVRREEWRAEQRLKWETQDREWEAAAKAGTLVASVRADALKERSKDQQALAKWKPDEDAEKSTRAAKQPKLEAEWKATDEEWSRLQQTWADEDREREQKYDRLTAATPETILVRVKYRALNRVGQNELADDIFSLSESKVARIGDKGLVAWLLPRMDKLK